MNFSKSHILLVFLAFFSIFGFTGFILTIINLNNCNSHCNNYKITDSTKTYKKQPNKKNDLLIKRQQNDLKYVLNKFKPHRNNQPPSNYTNITPISKIDQQYKVPQKHNNHNHNNNNSQIQTYQMPKAIRTDRRKMLEPHQMIRSNQIDIPNTTPIASLV